MARAFECRRGGQCCTRTGCTGPGDEFGMYLTPEEARHFPADMVFPLLRAGDRVFAYQLGVSRFPNLSFKDGLAVCGIYEHRPLACRAFPVTLDEAGGVAVHWQACPCTADFADDEWDMGSFGECAEAAREQVRQAEENPLATEVFDLRERSWVSL